MVSEHMYIWCMVNGSAIVILPRSLSYQAIEWRGLTTPLDCVLKVYKHILGEVVTSQS